ncbi:uncharacterized protein [Ptychodera flava]|uniref:uncharacterized protein n=1 Tax=Ptychodera flava TaxID=63121 RepID=UPI00396A8A32
MGAMKSRVANRTIFYIFLVFLLLRGISTKEDIYSEIQVKQDASVTYDEGGYTPDSMQNAEPVYEFINPTLLHTRPTNDLIVAEFIGLGFRFTVTLNENRALVRPGALLVRKQSDGDVEEEMDYRNCHFIGKAIREPLEGGEEAIGRAAFQVCGGLDGSMFIDGSEVRVTPVKGGNGPTNQHVIHHAEIEDKDMFYDMIKIGAVNTAGTSRHKRSVPQPSYVELLVAVDYDVFSDAQDESVDIALAHINKAQAIFLDDALVDSGVQVYFSVVKMVIFETDLLLNISGLSSWPDINNLYSTFGFRWESMQPWRKNGDLMPDYHDVALIFGGRNIEDTGDDDGVSSFKGCYDENHYIAIRYHYIDQSTRVLARQFGHILGMDDNYGNPNCSGSIMSDITMVTFDECNIGDYFQYVSSQEGSCFSDSPSESNLYDIFDSEKDRLDYACYSNYLWSANYASLRACPWRRTYESFSCELWCEIIDRRTWEEYCVNENTAPPFKIPLCGNSHICEGLDCYCPEGEDCDIEDGQSLFGIEDHFVTRATSFDNASMQCKAEGGVLAEILDRDIQDEIEELLNHERQYDFFYIGLHRDPSDTNEWTHGDGQLPQIYDWITDHSTERYFNWDIGEPNDESNAYVAISRDEDFKWIDYGYDDDHPTGAIGAVCQKQTSYYTYWVPTPHYTWSQALDHCRQFGGSLAKILNAQVQLDIEDFLDSDGHDHNDRIFFGLHKVNGTWFWTDGDELQSYYDNWKSGEPGNPDHDCAVLRHDYEWVDDDSTKTFQRYHLCQFECLEDASWCHHGYVELDIENRTCECVCDDGWKGKFCLQPVTNPGFYYYVPGNFTSYSVSREICKDYGGDLAQVRSPEMDAALAAFLEDSPWDTVMIGLHLNDGVWMESNGELLGSYINWRGTQPSTRDCADVRREYDWQWYGRSCSWSTVPHVCEFECQGDPSWCFEDGGRVSPYGDSCRCQCFYGWTGEFCEGQDLFYYVIEESTRGSEAADACRDINGRQAVIPNYDVHQRVIDYLNASDSDYNSVWFDLVYVDDEWVNADGPQKYFAWLWYDHKDCAVVRLDHMYQWQKAPCTWRGERYPLCEFDCSDSSWCINGEHNASLCSCQCDDGFKGPFCTDLDTVYWLHAEPVESGYTAGDGCVAAGNGSRLAVVSDEIIHQRVINYLTDTPQSDDRIFFDLRRIDNDTWVNSDGVQTYLPWIWIPNENQNCSCLRGRDDYDFAPTDCKLSGGRLALCETPGEARQSTSSRILVERSSTGDTAVEISSSVAMDDVGEAIHPRFYAIRHDTRLSQEKADFKCRERFGTLLEIPNQETQQFMEGWIASKTVNDLFYLGFRRDGESGDWEFVNGTLVRYFNWNPAENDDDSQACAVVSRGADYKWLDYGCEGGANFICQYDCHFETGWCVHGTISDVEPHSCQCVCEDGWKGDFCDVMVTPKKSIYQSVGQTLTFEDAREYCESLKGGRLPSVSEKSSHDQLAEYLKNSAMEGQTVYIDLALGKALWENSDRKTPRSIQWAIGEPRFGHNCAVVSSRTDYKWESVECDEQHDVVCQFSCTRADEEWCKHGDVVISGDSCECQCWPGSLGAYCEEFDYDDVLKKTILFYSIQRSGNLTDTGNRISWRGNSAMDDRGLENEDLTGGWYDAGDHLKLALNHNQNVWKLAWGFYEFKEAFEAAGQLDEMYDCLKWGTDYIMKLHTKPNEFYAKIGDASLDHRYWGRPEDMTMIRPAQQINTTHPGSDVAGNGAAALAASYLIFYNVDPHYAEELLYHAGQLYDFAKNYRGKWSDNVWTNHYKSSSYEDELTNAAVWMYVATSNHSYLEDAERFYDEFGLHATQKIFSWDKVNVAVQLMLYLSTDNTTYLEAVEDCLSRWLPGGNTPYTPKGLAWLRGQPLKKAADMSFIALVAAKHGIHTETYHDWARSQIHYILGDTGRSYLGGFGHNPPRRIHHRGSSCPDMPESCGRDEQDSEDGNPQVLYGGLVGGPDEKDRYFDYRRNWEQNEAGIITSGFQGAIAGLAESRNMKTEDG